MCSRHNTNRDDRKKRVLKATGKAFVENLKSICHLKWSVLNCPTFFQKSWRICYICNITTSQEYHWRIWFCKTERLSFNRFPLRQQCFQLLKSFVYSELDYGFLKPYHQQIQTLPLRFYGLINLLESFARDKFSPHFFTSSLNLFTEISSHNLRVFCQKIQFLGDAQSSQYSENCICLLSLS